MIAVEQPEATWRASSINLIVYSEELNSGVLFQHSVVETLPKLYKYFKK